MASSDSDQVGACWTPSSKYLFAQLGSTSSPPIELRLYAETPGEYLASHVVHVSADGLNEDGRDLLFAPDDSRVIFRDVDSADAKSKLYYVDLRGALQSKLPKPISLGRDGVPAWSRGGGFVGIMTEEATSYSVYLTDVTGGTPAVAVPLASAMREIPQFQP
jgi:Tol biopolymer transport system component